MRHYPIHLLSSPVYSFQARAATHGLFLSNNTKCCFTSQQQTAVTAHFSSQQLMLFAFALLSSYRDQSAAFATDFYDEFAKLL